MVGMVGVVRSWFGRVVGKGCADIVTKFGPRITETLRGLGVEFLVCVYEGGGSSDSRLCGIGRSSGCGVGGN